MNKNILIVLAGGFMIAVVVALMVQASLSGSKKKQDDAVKREARVEIVVASRALKTGEELKADNIKWQDWPKSGVFPGAVVKEKKDQTAVDALGGRVLRDVEAGEPLTKAMIVQETNAMMSAKLRPGMRAVSIDTKPSAIVSGFVNPGDYVDVILTYRYKVKYDGDDDAVINMIEANLSKLATETIIENVRVLGLDQRMNAPSDKPAADGEKKKAPKIAKTVTLEVSPEGAEVIGLARKMGDITLSLRRLGDDTVGEGYTEAQTDSRITNIWDELYATMEKMSADSAGQRGNIVRVYSGASASNVAVGQ